MYRVEKLEPPVRRKLFKLDTYGYYTIQVSHYPKVVTYNFQVKASSFFDTTIFSKPFQGEITMEGDNFFLLFAGILLMEQVLSFEEGDSG